MQRFYGGHPMEWLNMPLRWLGAYAEMLPRLRAREELASVNVIATGVGAGRTEDRQQLLRDLRQQAGLRLPPSKPKPEDLSAIGIGVRRVSDG